MGVPLPKREQDGSDLEALFSEHVRRRQSHEEVEEYMGKERKIGFDESLPGANYSFRVSVHAPSEVEKEPSITGCIVLLNSIRSVRPYPSRTRPNRPVCTGSGDGNRFAFGVMQEIRANLQKHTSLIAVASLS